MDFVLSKSSRSESLSQSNSIKSATSITTDKAIPVKEKVVKKLMFSLKEKDISLSSLSEESGSSSASECSCESSFSKESELLN